MEVYLYSLNNLGFFFIINLIVDVILLSYEYLLDYSLLNLWFLIVWVVDGNVFCL